jgi:hypothetical protein
MKSNNWILLVFSLLLVLVGVWGGAKFLPTFLCLGGFILIINLLILVREKRAEAKRQIALAKMAEEKKEKDEILEKWLNK